MSRDEPPPEAGKTRRVECPACAKPCAFEPWNPWRPFCSARCRTKDLGAWASEEYRVPGKPPDDDPDSGKPGPEG